ncbi:MAG TPA: redox-sensing transcriptional repressor Rex [Herpetosiphonaceae bacterium]
MDKQTMPPDVVVRRLPLYARTLAYLQQEGVKSVSSQELGARINVTAAQIRKDLSYFGQLGKQGIGYKVDELLHHINRILGLSQDWNVVLVGVGHLGQAIARYSGFSEKGIHIVGLFDADPKKIGNELVGLTIQHVNQISNVVREHNVRMAIVAVAAEQAQDVVNMLVKAGVEAILNYAPVIVQVPEGVWVRHIDPVSLLHSMTYYLARESPFEKP